MSQFSWPSAGNIPQIVNNGVVTDIIRDTAVPANTVPMPVELWGAAAQINITAGDINVQLSHLGVNYDSVRLGDGTNEVAVTASNELVVIDSASAAELALINAKLPGPLGAQTIATSFGVNIASDQVVPISAASLPLPTGAATEATLAAANAKLTNGGTGLDVVVVSSALPTGSATEATLSALNTKVTNGGTGIDVVVASSALPTGAATEATLAAIAAQLPATLGAKTTANSLAVNIASDQTVPISAASLPLPTGAATEATLANVETELQNANISLASIDNGVLAVAQETTLALLNGKIPALGQAAMAASLPVVLASNQTPIGQKGKSVVAHVRNDYSSTNVTTGAYVELIASTATDIHEISIFDSSGQTLVLAFGAAASEVDQIYVFPGGNGREPIYIASGTRISIKAVSGLADNGEIAINLYGV